MRSRTGYWTATAAVMTLLVLSSCASFSQKEDEVWRRETTDGELHYWKPLRDIAKDHVAFAWASAAAAQEAKEQGEQKQYQDGCPDDPETVLRELGYVHWDEVPAVGASSTPLEKSMTDKHLRAQVWSNQQRNEVIISFGGTKAPKDMNANLHWFFNLFGPTDDQYSVMQDQFTPYFHQVLVDKAAKPEYAWLKEAEFIPTGHSLGGGLAQGFAYAATASAENKLGVKIKTVLVFDPSPVTGKRETAGWQAVAKELTVYRIYNRGEILAALRSVFNRIPPNPDNATFKDVRYALNWHLSTPLVGFVGAHGIRAVACKLRLEASH